MQRWRTKLQVRSIVEYDKCLCECKKRHVSEIDNVWNPAACNDENRTCLASIMHDSVITSDKIIEETVSRNWNEKNGTFKTQNFYILLDFLLISIALLNYFYLIKYRGKQN